MNDQSVLELRTRWFPTRASGERSMLMQLEFAVNQGGNNGEPSMAEIAALVTTQSTVMFNSR